jgi:hypothetical protein
MDLPENKRKNAFKGKKLVANKFSVGGGVITNPSSTKHQERIILLKEASKRMRAQTAKAAPVLQTKHPPSLNHV